MTHNCTHIHTQTHTPAHHIPPKKHIPIHIYIYIHTHTPTHPYPCPRMHTNAHPHTSHLHCITMGWLPVLLWTLLTSSITSVTVFSLEQLPSGAQLVMWNWLTCCALTDCKVGQVTCYWLCLQPPSGTDLSILDTHSPQHKVCSLSTLSSSTVNSPYLWEPLLGQYW